MLSLRHRSHLQQLVRETLTYLCEATTVGFNFLQVEANKKALEALCKEKDVAYNEALMKWNEGKLPMAPVSATANAFFLQRVKDSKS
jgi:hypothetical protein